MKKSTIALLAGILGSAFSNPTRSEAHIFKERPKLHKWPAPKISEGVSPKEYGVYLQRTGRQKWVKKQPKKH